LDGNVVNFFRVLRDRSEELIRKIQLTPWARAEYELSLEPCEEPVEAARRFFMASWMSFNGGTGDNSRLFGWRHTIDWRSRRPASFDITSNDLDAVANRFIGVQIEHRNYQEVILAYDNDVALIYVDPPYLENERTNGKNWYACEWSEDDHIEAASILHECRSYVIISGYPCDLYYDLYQKLFRWTRIDKEAQTNSGGKRTESIWLSPRTVKALNKPQQIPLFQEK
jgi:DNA adenine methylase